MTVTETIRQRRSIRKYIHGADIPPDDLNTILEAAMTAPSACNSRPWEFIIIKSEEIKKEIINIHPFAKHLKDAATGIVICGRPDLQHGVSDGFWPQDCAAAAENILLQASGLGYGSCWCGIYPKKPLVEKFTNLLNITSIPFALITIGTPSEIPPAKGFYDETRISVR